MDTATATLSEFLLARIGEDEAMAAEALQLDAIGLYWTDNEPGEISISTERLRAECEAKRRIVERYDIPRGDDLELDETTPTPAWVLRLLALPFADHPDYRQEWRP